MDRHETDTETRTDTDTSTDTSSSTDTGTGTSTGTRTDGELRADWAAANQETAEERHRRFAEGSRRDRLWWASPLAATLLGGFLLAVWLLLIQALGPGDQDGAYFSAALFGFGMLLTGSWTVPKERRYRLPRALLSLASLLAIFAVPMAVA